MEEEKIPKQKPQTSFNRRLSVAKKNWGEHDNGQVKMFKFLFYRGTWQRGNMAKGITVFYLISKYINWAQYKYPLWFINFINSINELKGCFFNNHYMDSQIVIRGLIRVHPSCIEELHPYIDILKSIKVNYKQKEKESWRSTDQEISKDNITNLIQ